MIFVVHKNYYNLIVSSWGRGDDKLIKLLIYP